MRTVFFRIGHAVAARPLLVVTLSVFAVAISMLGLLRFRTETLAERLWVPTGTQALLNSEYVTLFYPPASRSASILLRAKPPTVLLSAASLLPLLSALETAWNASNSVAPRSWNARCVRVVDAKRNSVCLTSSPLDLFYNPDNVQKFPDGSVNFFASVRRVVRNLSDSAIRDVVSNPDARSFTGAPFKRSLFLADLPSSANPSQLQVMRYFQFSSFNDTIVNGRSFEDDADYLEQLWTSSILNSVSRLKNVTIEPFVSSTWSRIDALAGALTSDLPLLSAGFALLIIYVILFLGDFHPIRSHMLLAVGALISTALAIAGCFGVSSLLGMFFGPVHQILPLLLIGVGIDDCFHVTRSFDDINLREDTKLKPLQVRIALALSSSGSSITITSFTNVLVFLLGAVSRLPALRFFSLWAAIGIFLAWLLTITLFTAFLTLDGRRLDAKRRDCLPCCPPVLQPRQLNYFKKAPHGFNRFFAKTFAPFILKPLVRVVLLLLFIGWLATCSYGVSRLFLKFRFSFFYPADSDQRKYEDISEQFFKNGLPTNVYVRDRDLSISDNQRRLLELCDPDNGVIARNEWVENGSVSCWYTELRKTLVKDELIPAAQFVNVTRNFLGSPFGSRFNSSVLFSPDGQTVVGSRVSASYKFLSSNAEEIASLRSLRDGADSVGFGLGDDGTAAAFPYTFLDTFTEQFMALPGEIGISLGVACLAVGLVCLVLVGHVVAALICMVVVGMIIIDVLGLMFFSGVNLNSVSVISLVLSTGISVDFVVHIARSFLEQVGTRDERVIKALGVTGAPVFYAGFSTFLAVIVLAGARSYVFTVLFLGFMFLLVMGFLHGLVMGPILLSLLGPKSIYADEADKRRSERALERRVMGGDAEEEEEEEEEVGVKGEDWKAEEVTGDGAA